MCELISAAVMYMFIQFAADLDISLCSIVLGGFLCTKDRMAAVLVFQSIAPFIN